MAFDMDSVPPLLPMLGFGLPYRYYHDNRYCTVNFVNVAEDSVDRQRNRGVAIISRCERHIKIHRHNNSLQFCRQCCNASVQASNKAELESREDIQECRCILPFDASDSIYQRAFHRPIFL